MIEGSGSIPLINGSGSGSRRPKNMWIRIRNTGGYGTVHTEQITMKTVKLFVAFWVGSGMKTVQFLVAFCVGSGMKSDLLLHFGSIRDVNRQIFSCILGRIRDDLLGRIGILNKSFQIRNTLEAV